MILMCPSSPSPIHVSTSNGLFAIKLRKIRNFFSKNEVVPNCFSMFSQLDPSFGGSKSKICHRDLTRKKNYRLLCPKGYQKKCPVRDGCGMRYEGDMRVYKLTLISQLNYKFYVRIIYTNM